MAEYWDIFASSQMAKAAVEVSLMARTTPDKVFAAELVRWIADLKIELRSLAAGLPAKIDEYIRGALEASLVRPPTDKSRHLKDNIRSMPFTTGGANNLGAIGVAREADLDQTTNPDGGSERPYWLVIEEGSERWQPQMVGRVLFGKFQGPGGSSRPDQQRFREDSTFVFGGQGAGIGQIERAIEPHHYLEHGTDLGWKDYVRAIDEISARYAKRLLEIDLRRLERVQAALLEAQALLP